MLKKFSEIVKGKGVQRYVLNTGWLLGEKILRLIVGLSVSVLMARYLQPNLYGVFNYAQSFVGLFIVFATLGLDGVVVKELVKNSNRRDELLGTAFLLRLFGFIFLIIVLLVVINFMPNNKEDNIYIYIYACCILFQSFNVIDFFFQSTVQSKYSVYSRGVGFVISSLLKILLIILKAPLIAFVLVLVVESLILALSLVFYYIKNGFLLSKWRWSISLAKEILKQSWPLILSGIVVAIYMKIDQIMIKNILGDNEVGQYSAAVKLSEAWYFIPLVISNSLFPAIINAKKTNSLSYEQRIKKLYSFLLWISVLVALMTTFFGDWAIHFLYGDNYSLTSHVLKIHIWAGVFVALGVVSTKWFIIEDLQKYSFYRALSGAIVNVILNIYLIPKYGISGAAYATLIAQFIASYMFNLFSKATYPNFKMQTMAFIAPYDLYKTLKKLKK